MTREQRAHAREQRALLALRRSAVLASDRTDHSDESEDTADRATLATAQLLAAADRYTNALTSRERRKLTRRGPRELTPGRSMSIIATARAAESELATIARHRRPTKAESARAEAAYAAAARASETEPRIPFDEPAPGWEDRAVERWRKTWGGSK
jgi:hypothetical protein